MAKAEQIEGVALERSPSHLLHRALQHALDIYVEAVGAGAPTQRQFAVLSAVARNEGLTQTDLVRATGIDRSTLADLVARMLTKGLLARQRSSSDGRANAVRLTDKGRAALAEAQPKVAAADEQILAMIPARARESFWAVLLGLSEAAERSEARGAAPETEKAAKKRKKARAEAEARPEKKKKKKAKKA